MSPPVCSEYNSTIALVTEKWWLDDLNYILDKLLNVTGPHWWHVNTGSGNGMVPSVNKPLPELLLAKIYLAIEHHWATR